MENENKKGRRQVYQPEEKTSVIPAKDSEKYYPVDVLKRVYITSDCTLEHLAKEYNLPISILERFARTGEKSWHQLQKEYQEQRLKTLSEMREDLLIEKQSTVLRMEQLHLMRLNLRIAEIENHFKKYGDFYIRDCDEELIRDGKGQPIEITLPTSPKELLALKGLEDARETNNRLVVANLEEVASRKEKEREVEEGGVIDMDSYGIFNKNG